MLPLTRKGSIGTPEDLAEQFKWRLAHSLRIDNSRAYCGYTILAEATRLDVRVYHTRYEKVAEATVLIEQEHVLIIFRSRAIDALIESLCQAFVLVEAN